MVKLIVYEFRKHFLKRSIMAAIVVFTVLSAVKIYSVYNAHSLLSPGYSSPVWKGLYWEFYEEFGGSITDNKIRGLMEIYRPLEEQTADRTASTAYDNPDTYTGNVYNDYYFFQWNYVNPMKYAYYYKTYADEVVTAAHDNMDFYKSVSNTYEYRKNAVIADLFEGRSIPDFTYTEMYKYYLHYDFSALLVLLICLYGLMGVFLSEKEIEMDMLLLTTKHGGSRTTAAKLIASALFVCMVCAWFWLTDFAAFTASFGTLEGALSPLYTLENFVHSPLSISLGQYALLSGFLKTAGILVMSSAFLLVSSFFRNALIPYLVCLFMAFGSIWLAEVYTGSGHVLPKVINPFILIMNRELFRRTEFVECFGLPVLSYVPALILALVAGTACLAGITIIIRKNGFAQRGNRRDAVDL